MRPALLLLIISSALFADEATQKMMARVSEEAEAFQKLAPQVLGQETLHQRALKPPPRFHPRVGDAATTPLKENWQERTIVSEYGFTAFTSDPSSVREVRQVTSVDGKKIEDSKKAQEALAKVITASDDARKKETLKQFEKYGLFGAVTDYGQALLLFTRRSMERYEFTSRGTQWLNGRQLRVFGFKQIDGAEALTVFDAKNGDAVSRLRIEGQIWVRDQDYVPIRIIITASQGSGASAVREEASIDYSMSDYGALLPKTADHRETRGGKTVAENQFVYEDFKKFGASSDIKFGTGK